LPFEIKATIDVKAGRKASGSVLDTHNNWWVGGPGWSIKITAGEAIVTPDGKYYFEPVDDDYNQFNVSTSL
jgi:hypothetical protein